LTIPHKEKVTSSIMLSGSAVRFCVINASSIHSDGRISAPTQS
jgi:hypothetical protein